MKKLMNYYSQVPFVIKDKIFEYIANFWPSHSWDEESQDETTEK